MKNSSLFLNFSIFLVCCSSCFSAFSQNIQWQKSLGGISNETAACIRATSDGGYILTGFTNSNDGDVSGNHDSIRSDIWVVKLTSTGNIQWQKCLGGTDYDQSLSIQQTSDSGYILTGYTMSNDGDVSGNHGGTLSGESCSDIWVVKLTSIGNIQWQKCLGGTENDSGSSIQQTSDGGYILTGTTSSNDGDVSGTHNVDYSDLWVVKLSSIGNIEWQKCLGGIYADSGRSIQQTVDGGYILAGFTNSYDGDVSGSHNGQGAGGGPGDIWVVKLTSGGNIEWQKCLGGTEYESVNFMQQTVDGGYILIGSTLSNDGDVSGNHTDSTHFDIWVVKLNSTGNIQWHKCLGGTNNDNGLAIQQTSDGGYILSGATTSNDGDVSGNHDITNTYLDAWIVKLTSTGNIQWQKCFGGMNDDSGRSIQQTLDGGYIFAGVSSSSDGDVSGNHGGYDVWVVKLGNFGVGIIDVTAITDFEIFPNPVCEDRIKVSYTLSQSMRLKILIKDVLGNIVLCENETYELVGEHQKEMKLEGLASGTYFLELKTEYGSSTAKFVKN